MSFEAIAEDQDELEQRRPSDTVPCEPPESAQLKIPVNISAAFAEDLLRFNDIFTATGESVRAEKQRLRMSIASFAHVELTRQIPAKERA